MENQDVCTIKAFLQWPGSYYTEIRRFPLTAGAGNRHGLYQLLTSQVTSCFPDLSNLQADLVLTWKDSDGDYVMMTSDEEVLDAISHAKNNQLNIYITVEAPTARDDEESFTILNQQGYETAGGDVAMEHPGTEQQEQPTGKEVPLQAEKVSAPTSSSQPEASAPLPPHPSTFPAPAPPPPPPVFPWPLMFGAGHWGRRPRGFPGPMRRRGHHGPPHHHHHFPWENPAWHAHHFSPMMAGIFSMGWPNQFNSFGKETWNQSPQYGRGSHWNSCWPQNEQLAVSATRCDNIKNLITQVPCKHRRWARGYIRQWHQKNQNKETTLSGAAAAATNGSETNKHCGITMEEAEVPQAYAAWLDDVLPNFYKKQEENDAFKESLLDEKIPVPLAFQKWCLWFLTWHREGASQPKMSCEVGFRGKCLRKDWKNDAKISVPLKYRIWVKSYIKQWQRDHMIDSHDSDESSSSNSSSSDSEDAEQTLSEVISVPENYRMWLDIFLTRWHTRLGMKVQEATDLPTGNLKQFKYTVSVEFRKWVRCLMDRKIKKIVKKHKRYLKDKKRRAEKRHLYKKWMCGLYKQWIEDQGLGSVASSSSSSSSCDEDVEEKLIASSLKRMRLDQAATGIGNPSQPITAESDPAMPPCNAFVESGVEGTNENIPMMKIMAKLQKKQMKLAKKAAKRDAKAAWKAYKANN